MNRAQAEGYAFKHKNKEMVPRTSEVKVTPLIELLELAGLSQYVEAFQTKVNQTLYWFIFIVFHLFIYLFIF